MRIRVPFGNSLKRMMPRSLLGRSLLMILIPILALEGVALQIFYGSHLDVVSRRLSGAIADEIGYTLLLLRRLPGPDNQAWILRAARQEFNLDITVEPGVTLGPSRHENVLGPMDDDLARALTEKFGTPFTMDWMSDPRSVLIRIQVPEGVLDIVAPRKRLSSGTIFLFVSWLGGTALLFFVIAAMFMRIQVRALRRLARSAEDFGMGRDVPPIRPEGATEVRQAATAFNRMQERVRRFLVQRTEMLAGVSHDLRTPLTRLKLTLAMLPDNDELRADVADMRNDVEEMERMVSGYLAFARGEKAEQAVPVDLRSVLEDVTASARRSGAIVELDGPATLTMALRVDAMRRAFTNLIDNARQHARRIAVKVTPQERSVLVIVDDDGPGIPRDKRESVFRPFESNTSGGTGLGLTIARDIVRAHGGDIMLDDSPMGGLRALVRLPV